MYLSKTLKIYTQNYRLWWSPTEGRKDRYSLLGTSLVIQWLRPPNSQCRGLGFDPWWRNYILQATTKKITHAATKDPACCIEDLEQPNTLYIYISIYIHFLGFPDGSVVKNPPANAEDIGDAGSISESGRSPGEGNGYPIQYPCLENPMDRGAWQGSQRGPRGHKDSDMT